jgi:integrase
VVTALGAILDDAVEDDLIESNPARGKRMRVRVRVPKPNRTFLEVDELALLLDAAGIQDRLPDAMSVPPEPGLMTARVAHLLAQGYRPVQIARRLGCARSTVSFHLRLLGVEAGRGYAGRRVAVEILGRSGVRVSELCDLRIGQVRLHGSDGGRFRILDSKTETGIREVQMTPELSAVVREHLERLRRAGVPTGPKAYLVPNLHGGRMDRGRVARILTLASGRASERASSSSPRGCRRCRTRRRTRCGVRTSRSRCWRTNST